MAPERNLILVHQPERQALQDFYDIAALVEEMAPDIRTFVVYNTARNTLTRKKAAALPTLVFSPGELDEFTPTRGKIYAGRFIPKSEQCRRLAAAGVTVPATVGPGDDISKIKELSDIVLTKSDATEATRGQGIHLRRRESFERELANQRESGRLGYSVQSFIDTGRYPSCYRVHTLFGETLLAFKRTSLVTGATPDMQDDELKDALFQPPAFKERTVEICREPDVLDLAKRAYHALPEIPLHGCDIVRDQTSGELFVLEVNAGGNTWVFSKPFPGATQASFARDSGVSNLVEPFDAFRTAARALIARTRAEAQ